jgi:hypothetical protein
MTGVLPPERPSRPAPAAKPAGGRERGEEILACALLGESEGRPVRAIEALAALAVNRARLAAAEAGARLRFAPGAPPAAGAPAARLLAWPALLGAVCRAPFFLGRWRGRGDPSPPAPEGPEIDVCRRIAARAAAGVLPDPTQGATHWHDAAELPGWAMGLVPTALVGGLVFYRA